ncbi:MAG: NlpC/P60 family protein [Bacillota bacterium]
MLVVTCVALWASRRQQLAPEAREALKEVTIVSVPIADVRREPIDSSELVTQGLYGSSLTVLVRRPGWLGVKVEIQGGYMGFVHDNLVANVKVPEGSGWIVVDPQAPVYVQPREDGEELVTLYAGSTVYGVQKASDWVQVDVPPLGRGWMKAQSVSELGKLGPPNGELLIATARKFTGVPYKWGGVSVRGIDCSGLTYICCLVNGILIPRDADTQFESMKERGVTRSELLPGDLVFFSTNGQFATHVGFYEGNGMFLSALSSVGKVLPDQLDSPYWTTRFFGAARPY